MMWHWLVFSLLAVLITVCSVTVITHKNPVVSAVFLVLNLFFLAGVYAMQGADFIAAIQVLVYAGAIVVLFLFVIMLLNLDPQSIQKIRKSGLEYGVLGIIFCSFIYVGVKLFQTVPLTKEAELQAVNDHTYAIGLKLFTHYLWPFELASILILLAVIASIVIAKKKSNATK